MILAALLGIALTEQSTINIVVAVIGAVGVVLAAIITAFGVSFVSNSRKAQKSSEAARQAAEIAAHESKPNSGSTQRDAINRIESMVQTLMKDVGDTKTDVAGLREENRNDRKADSDRFDKLEGRVFHIEQKDKP